MNTGDVTAGPVERYVAELWTPGENAPLVEFGTTVSADSAVGPDSWVRLGSRLTAASVSSDVFVGFRTTLCHCDVGPSVLIASGVRIAGAAGARCVVGAGAWIGAGAELCAGVRVGEGAIVASGSRVAGDVPAGAVVAGRPAGQRAVRSALDDGLPRFRTLLTAVRARQRRPAPLASALAGLVAEPAVRREIRTAMLVADNPNLSGWDVGAPALVDADIEGGEGSTLGDGTILMGRGRRGSGLWSTGGLTVGRRVHIGQLAIVEGAGGVRIGDRARIGPGAQVLSTSHDQRLTSLPITPTPVVIGAAATVGPGALLIGPVDVPPGCEIPAGAVVVREKAGGIRVVGSRVAN